MTERLDAALAARGLARSRSHAATLISAGMVSVDGRPVIKAAAKVEPGQEITVAGADHYVSRAAHKLIAALDGFALDVSGRLALDLGASTGGFTQVLRERGAREVLAVDVGHGQMEPTVAADPGVVVVEGFNARYMTADLLAEAAGRAEAPTVVTGDLSFISLIHVLPAVAQVIGRDADVVLLVKPQFEVGRTAVKGGLVTNPIARVDAVERVLWAAWDQGLGIRGFLASPLVGTHGNAEYIVHLAPGHEADPSEWSDTVNRLAGSR
ncbi:TlyA family RNA methyltransferase [Microbacterium aurantiacum]|uniref:TlyA family RNA methyltransferase n=1 Tax=Microbacterium aurantiacum TaxID=162393 RepID=UPI001F35BE9F|nr:TlyA family RNA methyltransferase [Microbacterium aurantiacum]